MARIVRGDVKKRQALTQARTAAPVTTFGEPELARALGRALDVSGTPPEAARDLTHGFHTYPARMHPLTARRALAALGVGQGGTVLDPFCGSGTVLVEAARVGAAAFGVDASPLAVAVARAKVWRASAEARRRLVERARAIAERVVAEGKAARRAGVAPAPRTRRPEAAEKRLEGLWAPHVRRELEALAAAIREEPDEELRGILIVVLSSILLKVSRRESDTRARTVERRVARGMAARLFAARAEELSAGLAALWKEAPPGTPAPIVRLGDARDLRRAGIVPGTVQAIVTSPPYAGTYDYLEHHAPRLAFLGLPEEPLATREIGARRAFTGGPEALHEGLARWDRDLGAALAEMARALAPGGRLVLLVGDSTAGGRVAVYADETVSRLAPAAGLRVLAGASQRRALLGRAERDAFARRPKREHLILLSRAEGT